MASPRLVDLLAAPLRAVGRAQRALAGAILQWVRRMFPPRGDGVGAPAMLAVPLDDPHGRIEGVRAPLAALAPPPDLGVTKATIAFDLEIVQSRVDLAGPAAPLAFHARVIPPANRRRPSRRRGIQVEMTLRDVGPTQAIETLARKLSDRSHWQARGPRPRSPRALD